MNGAVRLQQVGDTAAALGIGSQRKTWQGQKVEKRLKYWPDTTLLPRRRCLPQFFYNHSQHHNPYIAPSLYHWIKGRAKVAHAKTIGRSTNPAERPLLSLPTRSYATAAVTNSDHALYLDFVPSTRIRSFRSRLAGRSFTMNVRRLL